jgi:glycosyltransferase involved in cell wall biosynthesis
MSPDTPTPDRDLPDPNPPGAPFQTPGRPRARHKGTRRAGTRLPSPMLGGLSIVLPCLDEEDNLARVLREARAAGRRVAAECEIIVVDDGSQDATAVIAGAEAGVRVIRHGANRGRGAAVRSGLLAARMPHVLVTDADGQFDMHQIVEMVPQLESADIVVGSPRGHGETWGRRVADRLWNRSVRRLAPLPLRDPDCSFTLLRRDVLDGIELHSDGRALGAELLTKCLRAGATVTEVGIDQRPRRGGGRRHGLLASASGPRHELAALRASIDRTGETP